MTRRPTILRRPSGPRSRTAAFSLVELVVAVGVIAVLMALLLSTAAGVRRSAHQMTCVGNLRTLGQGMLAYAGSFRGALPWEGFAEGDRAERHLGPWDEPSTWLNAAPKYAGATPYGAQIAADDAGTAALPRSGDTSLFVCPEAGPAVAGPKDDLVVDGYFMMWGLDRGGAPTRRKTYLCYAYNTQLDEGVEDRHSEVRVTIFLPKLRRPGETVLLLEKLVRPDETDPPFGASVAQQEASAKEFTTRHWKGGNVLFADAHVGWFGRAEVLSGPGAPLQYNQPGKLIWDPRYAQ